MSKFFRFVVIIGLSFILSSKVYAQGIQDLGEILVTTSRMAQYDYKVTGNVTVITKEEIQNSNAQNVPDILKEALGVNIYDNSTAKSSVIDIRGFGDTAARNVLVLVNDRKINNVDISSPELVQIPIDAIERIEIIRGAGSVLYGDNAVGGVVNIITKKGKGNLSGRLGLNYGSYGTSSEDVEVSGEKNDINYFVYGKYFDDHGYRDNSDMLAKDFNTRVGYNFFEKVDVDLNVGWHQDVQELPGGLTDSQLQTLGRRATANDMDIAYTKDRYVRAAFDVNPWPEDENFGHLVFDYYYRNRDVYDAFYSFGEFSTKRNIETNGITTKYMFNREVLDHDVNFVVGSDWYDTQNDILGSGSNVDDITISKEELGLFTYTETELLDKLYLNAGTRYHKANYAFSQRNVAVDQKQKPDEQVWMGGMKYEYAPKSNVFFDIQKTFRFLATDEWYSTANFPGFGITPGLNLDLQQQTGIQYEAGVKHNFNDSVELSVTPYYMKIRNEIFFDPVTFANSNYDRTRRYGVEFGSDYDLKKIFDIAQFDRIKLFANYDYQNPVFVGGASDHKDIPMAPRQQATHGLTVGFKEFYDVSLIGRYIGSRFAINDTLNATDPIKPYYVTDMKVSCKHPNWEIYAGVNNMFNKLYETYTAKSAFSNTKSHFPAPERNYVWGMNLKF